MMKPYELVILAVNYQHLEQEQEQKQKQEQEQEQEQEQKQEQEQGRGQGARCGGRRRPKETRACRLQPCPPRWLTSPWTPCSCARGGTGGRSRQVVCRQGEQGGASCRGGARPHTTEQCSCVDQVSTGGWGFSFT